MNRSLCLLLLALGLVPAAWATDEDQALAAKAATVFGARAEQSFDSRALRVAPSAGVPRTDAMSLTLAPGKGAELKALIGKGQSFVFHWTASADLAVDMHGEVEGAKEYTSYAIEAAQREASGSFTAGFDGVHGWFWLNRGKAPVTLRLTLSGFHKKLIRPGH